MCVCKPCALTRLPVTSCRPPPPPLPPSIPDQSNASWHLVGITTLPSGQEGYQLYVDGLLAGEASGNGTFVDYVGGVHTVNGGTPMNLTGDLTLCARSDLNETRFWSGQIAAVLIWNESLVASDWMTLYDNPKMLGRLYASPSAAAASPTPAASTYPTANAYFPLLSESLTSVLPVDAYHGVGTNITWTNDAVLGRVLTCNESNSSRVTIPGISYGQNGSWALAFWAKWELDTSSNVSYMLSQNNSGNADPTLSPDLVSWRSGRGRRTRTRGGCVCWGERRRQAGVRRAVCMPGANGTPRVFS